MEQRVGYDELAVEEEFGRMTRRLRQPQGRRRDASIVGLDMDALRHKDGSLTVAYEVATPASMFADDQLVDIRYDDLARMLSFDKPTGTLVQFRYATTPDPGHAINSVIASRARAGNHVLAGLLQASNLDWLRTLGKLQPFRRSVLTMWVRVPPKQRGNSTIDALANFKGALLTRQAKAWGSACRPKRFQHLLTHSRRFSCEKHVGRRSARLPTCKYDLATNRKLIASDSSAFQ